MPTPGGGGAIDRHRNNEEGQMSRVTYQTIRLSRGKHAHPEQGACVMELASMLAGEQFSDHPASVCPVIGCFLRAYNDYLDDDRRQDLYAYASKVVGSRGPVDVQWARADRLRSWAANKLEHRWSRCLLPRPVRRIGRLHNSTIETIGNHAIRAIPKRDDRTHVEVLALIDELLGIGVPQDLWAVQSRPLRTPDNCETPGNRELPEVTPNNS
jgi:hypothetical protein